MTIIGKNRGELAEEREPRTPQESAPPELFEVFQILGGVRGAETGRGNENVSAFLNQHAAGAETGRGERKCVRGPQPIRRVCLRT